MRLKTDFPNYIMIQTTTGCNAKCFFCPYPYLKNNLKHYSMPDEIFGRIISECKRYKNIKVIMPYLMNEPLLDVELPEKIAHIKKELPWVYVHILTNGSLLDENYSKKLIKSGIDWVGFSIHGINKETISNTMHIDYEKTIQNIKNFIEISKKEKKDITKYILITLIKNKLLNDDEIKHALEFWKDNGIERISLYPSAISRAGNVPDMPKINNKKIFGCNSIWSEEMIHITANGEVALCCMDWKKENIPGDIRKSTLHEVWNSKEYEDYRKQINAEIAAAEKLICLRCECAEINPIIRENRIMLAILPPWGVKQPPTSLGLLSEILESKGYTTEILDINILLYNKVEDKDKIYWEPEQYAIWEEKEFTKQFLNKYRYFFEKISEQFKKTSSKITAFSVPTASMHPMLKWAVNEIKNYSQQNWVILEGASLTTELRREIFFDTTGLKDKIDVIIPGDSEETISLLCEKILSNKPVNDIENMLLYRDGVQIKAPQKKVNNLNSLPIPKYAKFTLNLYQDPGSLSVEWLRGHRKDKSLNKKSPEKIVDELEFYKNKLGKNKFYFLDISMTPDLEWIEQISDMLIKRNLNITINGLNLQGRNIQEFLLKKIKKAGFSLEKVASAQSFEKNKKPVQKNADIILATTPPWGVNNPPLGLAYLASYIRKFNLIPAIFDMNIEFYNSVPLNLKLLWHVENKNFWSDKKYFPLLLELFNEQIESSVKKLLKIEAPYIGFSVVDPKERLTIEFIKRIKIRDKNRKIILGGPACLTEQARRIFVDNLDNEISCFVFGEGEETLKEILSANNLKNVKGIVAKEDGFWIETKRNLIKDINQLPYPTYEDFNLNLYNGKSLILEWSRGCTGKCAFCINHELVNSYRFRNPEHILNELKFHINKNNIKNFTICDPLINGKPKILDKLCDLIIQNNLYINWSGEAAPRNDMDIDILKKMKDSGCLKLQIGVESGSDKVLNNMRKTYTSQDAEQFIKKASLAGIETEIFVMIGFPGEDDVEFEKTAQFIKRNSAYINTIKSINTLHLIAGTDIYKNPQKYNIKPLPKENWYYLWETYDGNNYSIRKKRGEKLLGIAEKLGIKVLETNLKEGKHNIDETINLDTFKNLLNTIQPLPASRKVCREFILPRKRLFKLAYLVLVILLTIAAETYLWILRNARRMIIFPGS